MRSQQQAERAEQQRIKNLVLNYDLTDDQHDGEDSPSFHYISSPSSKRTRLVGTGTLNKSLARANAGRQKNSSGRNGFDHGNGHTQHETSPVDSHQGSDSNNSGSGSSPSTLLPPSELDVAMTATAPDGEFADGTGGHIDHLHSGARQDKSGNSRSKQRARKLQLGDIDWYDDKSKSRTIPAEAAPPGREVSLDDLVKKPSGQRDGASSARGGRGGGGSLRGKRRG